MPIFDAFPALLTIASVIAYQYVPAGRLRVLFLVAVSAGYIAWLDAGALLVALVMATFTYLVAAAVRRLRPGLPHTLGMTVAIAALLGALIHYRYLGLLPGGLGASPQGAAASPAWVPLGISFLTFRLIAYLVDQQQPHAPRPAAPQYALFVLFFPTFIAGPLERWTTFSQAPTLALDPAHLGPALERILYGIAKKVILADRLASYLSEVGAGPQGPTQGDAWILFFGLGIQIYLDFAAYTDIAVGLSRLFGYRVMENFDRPYLARNMADFWRRWHISLSEWIRVYLFMPLATRRATPLRLHLAVLVSMSLCGLWHGAGLSFLIWGVWHGLGISACHLWASARRRSPLAGTIARWRGAGALSVAMTYAYVSCSFVLFARPMDEALRILRRMVGWD